MEYKENIKIIRIENQKLNNKTKNLTPEIIDLTDIKKT